MCVFFLAQRFGGPGGGLQRTCPIPLTAQQELPAASGTRQEGAPDTQSGESCCQSVGSAATPLFAEC